MDRLDGLIAELFDRDVKKPPSWFWGCSDPSIQDLAILAIAVGVLPVKIDSTCKDELSAWKSAIKSATELARQRVSKLAKATEIDRLEHRERERVRSKR